ncbi:MAG: hypothetical protein KDB37_09815 [Ilumatobacter sp.]|nr:hypothetical protein [Ilumatobacter sp.]
MSPNRRPIVIVDDQLSTGHHTATVRPDDAEALLRDYLRLIRRVRNQQRARNIALRRVDIEALADHLGWTADQVLARLADLMGTTRRQRATMLAVLSTGAALITIASPMSAAATGTDGVALDQTEPPVVVDADEITHVSAGVGRALPGPTDTVASSVPRRAPVLDVQADLASFTHAVAPHRFKPTEIADEYVETVDEPVASEPAVGPDGATIAVGKAPVPPTPASTSASTPASAEPAADVVESVAPPIVVSVPEAVEPETGIDADGNTVAVGLPPVPPTPAPAVTESVEPETGIDADGNTVAVGLPPVPPTPDA